MHRRGWTESVLTMGVALALSAAPALAGGDTDATKSGDRSSPSAMPGAVGAGDYEGRHTMSGEVTKIDQRKGHITLKTEEGNLELHFPANALQNVKKGDRVSVELALKAETASGAGRSQTDGSASPRTQPDPSKKGSGTQSQ
jgi:hypothetical protein